MSTPRLQFHLLKVGHCTHPECVAQRGGRWRSVQFPALCALLIHPMRGPILFDTGYSKHFLEATAPFPERFYRWTTPMQLVPEEQLATQLQALGIGVNDVQYVMLSHLHGDHSAGSKDFPRARFIVSRAECDTVQQYSRIGALSHGYLRAMLPTDFADRLMPVEDMARCKLPAQLAPFEEGFDIFGDGSLLAVPLPGHTSGQMGALFCDDSRGWQLLAADACWSLQALRANQPPTWIAQRILHDKRRYLHTFEALRRAAAHPDAVTIIPSHCEATWSTWRDQTR